MEVDVLTNRLRNIKQSYITTNNQGLKDRLFSENKNIFKRIYKIYRVAEQLNKTSKFEKFSFSNLLFEKTKRVLSENKFESNLFFL